MYKKILFGTCLTEYCDPIFNFALNLARENNAKLWIYYGLAHYEPWYGEFDSYHIDRVMDWQIKKAHAYQKDFCSRHLEDCATYTTHIEVGNPAQKTLEFIDDKKIDMVVMCRTGKTGDFDMGNVAQKVAIKSPVPVAIAPSSNYSKE